MAALSPVPVRPQAHPDAAVSSDAAWRTTPAMAADVEMRIRAPTPRQRWPRADVAAGPPRPGRGDLFLLSAAFLRFGGSSGPTHGTLPLGDDRQDGAPSSNVPSFGRGSFCLGGVAVLGGDTVSL